MRQNVLADRSIGILILALLASLEIGCGEGGPLASGPAPLPEPVFGRVLGRVTVDGFPRGGVHVTLTRGGASIASIVTATSGEYEFAGLEPGVYSVVISQIVGASCATLKAATVQGGERTEVNFACASPLIDQVPRGSVMGRVTRNGIGLAGVEVLLCYGDSWWDGCFEPVQVTNSQGLYAYDMPGRFGLGTYFVFANCEPHLWGGGLTGPTSARVLAGAGRHERVNFDCP